MLKNKRERMQEPKKDDTIIKKNERHTVLSFFAKLYLEIAALIALLITFIAYAYLMLHKEIEVI